MQVFFLLSSFHDTKPGNQVLRLGQRDSEGLGLYQSSGRPMEAQEKDTAQNSGLDRDDYCWRFESNQIGGCMGSVEGDELRFDQDSVNPEPYMTEALNMLVEKLMYGEKIGQYSIHDYLEDYPDLAETVSAFIITGDKGVFNDAIELILRRALENSDEQHDLAVELARGE